MRSAGSFVCDGALHSLKNKGLRPLFTLAAPPYPRGEGRSAKRNQTFQIARDQIARLGSRFAERKSGVWGQSKKVSLWNVVPKIVRLFYDPHRKQNSRAASVPRERSGVEITASVFNPAPSTNQRERFQSRPRQITATPLKSPFTRFCACCSRLGKMPEHILCPAESAQEAVFPVHKGHRRLW